MFLLGPGEKRALTFASATGSVFSPCITVAISLLIADHWGVYFQRDLDELGLL